MKKTKLMKVYLDDDGRWFYTYADDVERSFELAELGEQTTKLNKKVSAILPNFVKTVQKLKKKFFGKLLSKVKLKKATKEVKQAVALYEKGDLERFEKALDKLVQEDERGFENENT